MQPLAVGYTYVPVSSSYADTEQRWLIIHSEQAAFRELKTFEKHLEKEVQKIAAATVDQAMTPHPVTVSPSTPIEEIASLMVDRNFHTLPVLVEGKLVGIVGKEDLLKLLLPESDR